MILCRNARDDRGPGKNSHVAGQDDQIDAPRLKLLSEPGKVGLPDHHGFSRRMAMPASSGDRLQVGMIGENAGNVDSAGALDGDRQ